MSCLMDLFGPELLSHTTHLNAFVLEIAPAVRICPVSAV